MCILHMIAWPCTDDVFDIILTKILAWKPESMASEDADIILTKTFASLYWIWYWPDDSPDRSLVEPVLNGSHVLLPHPSLYPQHYRCRWAIAFLLAALCIKLSTVVCWIIAHLRIKLPCNHGAQLMGDV
jgi:hypothetical protein